MSATLPIRTVDAGAVARARAALLRGDRDAALADADVLETALATPEAEPRVGRAAETLLLRAAGYGGLPLGRIYEGHVNALQLVARIGTAEQRAAAEADVRAGLLFGVWNTGAADDVRIVAHDAAGARLVGRKTFCSGVNHVARAIISGRLPGGGARLVIVDMRRAPVVLDPSFWKPFGMADSESWAVDFSGVLVPPCDVLGEPGVYERQPWFGGGAARFVAVQTGGVERLADEYAAWVRGGPSSDDPIVLSRLGACAVAAGTCVAWTEVCRRAWEEHDAGGGDAGALVATVDAARCAIERAALDVCEAVERGAGARGLIEPAPFPPLVRDMRMYLRQPAPDQALIRVGRAALARPPAP